MAEEKQNPRDESFREMRQAGTDFVAILNEMKAAMKEVMKDAGATAIEMERMKRSQKDTVSLASALSNFTKEDLKKAAKRDRFNRIYNKAINEQKDLQKEIDEIVGEEGEKIEKLTRRQKIILKQKQDQLQTSQDLTREAENLTKEIRNLEGATSFFKGMSDFTKDIPLLNKIIPEFENANKAAVDNFAETGSGLSSLGAGISQLLTIITKAFIGLTVKGLLDLDKRVINVQRNLNLSAEASTQFDSKLREATAGRMVDLNKVNDALVDVSTNLGFAGVASVETGITLEKLTGKLGLSADQAANLFRATAGIEGSFKNTTAAIIGQTMASNANTNSNIRYQDVLADISDTSSEILLTQRKFPGGIANAAFQARRFGLELSTVASAGENLLDFQSSIEKEMEAELLLGRSLNLDRARAAALMGDQATLAEEIAGQVGTAEEFSNLNVIQQKALADAMGMSTAELAKSLMQREALLKLEEEQNIAGLAKMNVEERIAALMDKGMSREKALKALGEEELLRQENANTATEAMSIATTQMAAAAADLAVGFSQMGNPLSAISESLKFIVEHANKFVYAMAGVAALTGARSLFKLFKGIGKFIGKMPGGLTKAATAAKGFFGLTKAGGKAAGKTAAKAGAKGLGKGLGKSLLKKIPGVGLLAGLGFGISRAMQGDFKGALGEVASGAVSLIPGVGTALSAGIDAGLIARDMGAFGDAPGSRGAQNVGDFVLRPLDKDTITMAGGTKLGGNVEELLERLITIVEGGGDVFLDGSKVGETLVMNSRLTT